MLSKTGFDLSPPNAQERARLEASLSQEERRVLLNHGTEAPFCGGLLGQKKAGIYSCRLCGLPLFRQGAKFESGTGWPSFTEPCDGAHVDGVEDLSYAMARVETRCARCGKTEPRAGPFSFRSCRSFKCRWGHRPVGTQDRPEALSKPPPTILGRPHAFRR